MPRLNSNDVLQREIPYRLDAVHLLNIAAGRLLEWRGNKPMQILFAGTPTIEGTSSAFFNPVFEAGLVHCRALLEFVGLRADSTTPPRLVPRNGKRADDFGIEDFSVGPRPLSLVTPSQAIAGYRGNAAEAEAALTLVMSGTNKLLAHLTHGFDLPEDRVHLIEIATRGVRAIVVSHLYRPLGLPDPPSNIRARRRDPA